LYWLPRCSAAGSLTICESGKGLKLLLVSARIGLVRVAVIARLRSVFGYAVTAVREALRPRRCPVACDLATDLFRSRVESTAENVLLRQQLIVAARKVKRPVFRRHERTLITALAELVSPTHDAASIDRIGQRNQGLERSLFAQRSELTLPSAGSEMILACLRTRH
jgi:hypothetical protein